MPGRTRFDGLREQRRGLYRVPHQPGLRAGDVYVVDVLQLPSGCCRGTTCVPPGAQSTVECGTGGSTCAACSGPASCNTSGGGCQVPDAGFPPIPDGGGFFQPCTFGSDCAPGDCCYDALFLRVCATIGNPNLISGITCGRSRQMCGSSCQSPMTCNAQGTCQ